MKDTLSIRSTARDLVATFQAAEATVRRCFAELEEAQARLNASFVLDGGGSIRILAGRWCHNTSFDDADGAVDRMKRDAWRVIVDRLELRRILSTARWKKLENQIDNGEEVPPIDEETLLAFVEQNTVSMDEAFAEKVAEAWDYVRPRTTDLKTNGGKLGNEEVPERVILPRVVERYWPNSPWHVNHHHQQDLIVLESVFRMLAGDPQRPLGGGHGSDLEAAICAAPQGGHAFTGATGYFEFRGFSNGNLHMKFKRKDLLARMNAIAGARRLRSK